MLNSCIFIGRITKEPELKRTNSGIACCNFQLAVERIRSDVVDFPEFVCFKKTAENLCRYIHKGDLISVSAQFRSKIINDKKYHEFKVTEIIYLEKKSNYENYDDIEIPE